MKHNIKIMKFFSLFLAVLFVLSCTACSSTDTAPDEQGQTTLFGKITAIDGNSITLALAQQAEGGPEGGGTPGDAMGSPPSGAPTGDGETAPPDMPSEAPADGGEQPQAPASSAQAEIPADDVQNGASDSQAEAPSGGQPPEMPEGGAGGSDSQLTGESQTITVNEETGYTISGQAGSLSDLAVDDWITVTLSGNTVVSIQSGGMRGGPGGGSSASSVQTTGVDEVTDTQTESGGTYDSTQSDVSSIQVSQGGSLTLSDAAVSKSGDTSNTENSEFYGLNAAILVKEASSAVLDGLTITTDAEGANAVFATGENADIQIRNSTISTSANSSRGLDATYGGSITAEQVTIQTQGSHSAALATDRGEGTVTASGSSLQTAGEGSPCIYSTGAITLSSSTGLATGSSIAVVEGKNSITVTDSDLTGYGIGRAGGGIDDAGVMIYQSMSGDAGEGTGTFTAANSTLSIDPASDKYASAPMFFVTNTDAEIHLTSTKLSFGSGILLNAAGNDGEWGTAGSNGGNVTMTAEDQTLEGDITADSISTVSLTLSNSTLSSAVNGGNSAKSLSLTLDAGSTWNVTGTSYLTAFTNADADCSNIQSNGYTVYYDAGSSANAWLNGATLSLPGGGSLAPMNA